MPSLTDLRMMAAMRIAANGRTLARVTDRHRDLLLSYEVIWYNDHARVEFTLTSATPPPLHNFTPGWLAGATEN